MRILDVTTFYAPHSGGVKTYLDAKLRHLPPEGFEHAIVVPDDASGLVVRGRSRVYRICGPAIPFSPGYHALVSRRELENVIALERPDVVEVGSPFLAPFLVGRAVSDRRVRTVGFYHSDLIRTYVVQYAARAGRAVRWVAAALARRLIRRVYGSMDVTVAASPSVCRELEEIGVSNVRHVPLGVDLELFRPDRGSHELRDRLRVPDQVPIALYAGRFCAEKALDVLLEAHLRLPASHRLHLVLVGEGVDREALEREARQRSRMTVLPYVEDRLELARIYAGADFYVAPGPGETFGLSIAEALASGLPVVAVDSGAAPDRIAESGCGRLYRRDDPESCARALRETVDALGPALARRAREHAEASLGWDRTFERLFDLYRELAGVPAPAGRPGATELPETPPLPSSAGVR